MQVVSCVDMYYYVRVIPPHGLVLPLKVQVRKIELHTVFLLYKSKMIVLKPTKHRNLPTDQHLLMKYTGRGWIHTPTVAYLSLVLSVRCEH